MPSQPIDAGDDNFWEQFWGEQVTSVQDVFALIPACEIRSLREEAPSNLATLCYKAVERLVRAADTGCSTQPEQQVGESSVRGCLRIERGCCMALPCSAEHFYVSVNFDVAIHDQYLLVSAPLPSCAHCEAHCCIVLCYQNHGY